MHFGALRGSSSAWHMAFVMDFSARSRSAQSGPRTQRGALLLGAVVEHCCLFRRADQTPGQRACLQAALRVKFAEMCGGLLNHATADAHAAQ